MNRPSKTTWFSKHWASIMRSSVILDADQGSSLNLRMWLTVPLLLIVAPATAIALGGFVAARR